MRYNRNKQEYKVLHITTIDLSVKKLLIDKLKELEKYGYTIETMAGNTGIIDELEKTGFTHHPIEISRDIRPLTDIKTMYQVYKILKTSQFDIVHTHTAKAGFIGRIAARLAGVPIVVHTSHGLPFYKEQPLLKKIIYKRLEQIASWFSDGYLSQNFQDISIMKPLLPKKVVVGYEGNGIARSLLTDLPRLTMERKKEIKKQLDVADDYFLFLMGARFEPIKNHDMLINAIRLIRTDRSFQVILAGDGPLLEKYREAVGTSEFKHKIKFLGFRDDVHELIQVADAVILTSEKEGIPRIVMEAMALGKPVLATDVSGTNELIIHDKTGELVQLNDVEELARRMNNWIDHKYKVKLDEYGTAAYQRINENFTETIVAKRVNKLYQELLKEKNNR